ncbi:YhcG family protein [uncultured Eubacterium sp.]|uniref:PDDEXK nuclease domain-containing protein n=1 Tax=uncultured Eubacterium sp. TaxID=165185 RepID=UPI0025947067|nr:PDDEXK nuclease domain-containing protein [uncultured Eubacterium sp.]
MGDLIKKNETYKQWITEISENFRKSQLKAAVKVNESMLQFYWLLGKEMDEMKENFKWGSHFYDQISKDLADSLPEVKSFSPRNLLFMSQFYRLFPNAIITKQDVSQMDNEKVKIAKQAVSQIEKYQCVFMIPWGHIIQIINKCSDNSEKALFYVNRTVENNWSRNVLLNFLDTDLYEREGKAITNFTNTLPATQSDLAQSITKDPYNFDFLTIREKYDEKELKDALINDISKFLMELGTGFAYMGREVRLMVGDKEKFIDLLFYNTKVHCYVVIEVKTGEFDSSNAGQLGTYVVAVNHQLKGENDNPTIGLLVCKGLDKVEAQYALESSSQPIGVSSYELSRLIPDKFKGSMPTIEEIEAELTDDMKDREGGQNA